MGVIGAGAWGRNHGRTAATLPEAGLVAVCDADPKTRERIGRQYPAVHVTADVADLLSRVDAVVIASPATTHARVALQCVEAGKPCLVEKPFALSTRDAEAVATASASRVLRAKGFSTRHGFPASTHCNATRACVVAGEAITTASTRLKRSATSAVTCTAGYWRPIRSRVLGSASHTATSSASGRVAAVRTWFFPHAPAPITPILRRVTGRT